MLNIVKKKKDRTAEELKLAEKEDPRMEYYTKVLEMSLAIKDDPEVKRKLDREVMRKLGGR